MKRFTKFITVAAVGAAGVVGLASQAGATVSATHVDKGDVQSVLKWNNADFDAYVGKANDVVFTGGYTYDNVLTCGANAGGKVVNVKVGSTDATVITAKQIKSGNGKQINGWDLATGAAGSNDLNAVMQATFTACLPDKPYTEMTPEELRRLPVKVEVASTPTFSLFVNGTPLPLTPIV
jgi:hypothetical protein